MLHRHFRFSASIGLLSCVMPCAVAAADVVPSSTTQAELKAWSAMYWHMMDTGQPATGAASFRFTDPAFNSVLMSPVRGSVRALQRLHGGVNNNGCTPTDATQTGGISYTALRPYMVSGKVSTDFVVDAAASAAHLDEILNGDDTSFTWSLDGTVLESTDLTASISASQHVAATAATASGVVQGVISRLQPMAIILAAEQDLSDVRVTDLLTGAPPSHFLYAYEIQSFLGAENAAINVAIVEAAFGKYYCSLPMLRVDIENTYVLIDAINGNLIGPFAAGSAYDARPLLQAHSAYSNADAVEYVAWTGCTSKYPVADTKVTRPGAPPAPWAPIPARPATPNNPGWPAGNPSPWVCTTLPSGVCECKRRVTYRPSPAPAHPGTTPCPAGVPCPPRWPQVITEEETCTWNPGTWGGFCNTNPQTPGGGVPIPPGAPRTCTSEHYWWE